MEPLNQTHSLTDFSSWRGEVKCGVKCGVADLQILEWANCGSSREPWSANYPLKATFNELCSKTIMVHVPHATEDKNCKWSLYLECIFAKVQNNSEAIGTEIMWKMDTVGVVFLCRLLIRTFTTPGALEAIQKWQPECQMQQDWGAARADGVGHVEMGTG